MCFGVYVNGRVSLFDILSKLQAEPREFRAGKRWSVGGMSRPLLKLGGGSGDVLRHVLHRYGDTE
jgi:hypothetical protein